MDTRILTAAACAANLVISNHAEAFSRDRLHTIINGPAITNQHVDDIQITGHAGWSLDVSAWRGDSSYWTDRGSTGGSSSVMRYTIAWGAPERTKRECRLSWADHGRVAVTALVWAFSNRLLRGDDDIGGQLPGGATFTGQAIPWMITAALHDNLSYGQAAGHIAADIFSEQIAGWSGELDMGYSAELAESHPAHNPGDRWQDQIGMSAHLYRARALSMAMLHHRHGDVDGSLIAHGAIGGAGYQLGRFLGDEGVTAGWETDRMTNRLFGSRPYVVGESVAGASLGVGISRTLSCD